MLQKDKSSKKTTKHGKIDEETYNDIDVLTDEKKKKQLIHAFSNNEDIKQKLLTVLNTAPKLELTVSYHCYLL